MRGEASRVTITCPECRGQIVVRLVLPKVEHRAIKRPQLLSVERPTGCDLEDEVVRRILGF